MRSASMWGSCNMALLNAAPVREIPARGSRYLPESQRQPRLGSGVLGPKKESKEKIIRHFLLLNSALRQG